MGGALTIISFNGALSLQHDNFKYCTVNATGWAYGGALLLGIRSVEFGYSAVGLSIHSTLATCSTFPCFALGGGLYAFNLPFANISRSMFQNVSAVALSSFSQAAGGGMFTLSAASLNISSSTFVSAIAKVVGTQSYAIGAALTMQQNGLMPATVSHCLFSNCTVLAVGNESGALGGAFFSYAKFNFTKVTIFGCGSACEGVQCLAAGGAYVSLHDGRIEDFNDMPLLHVQGSVFAANSAVCNSTGSMRCAAQGGAFFFGTASLGSASSKFCVRLLMSRCLLTGNSVLCSRGTGSVSNGGAVSCNSCNGSIAHTLFQENSVNSFSVDGQDEENVEISGGGLYASLQQAPASTLLLLNSSFVRNSAIAHALGLSGTGGGATAGFRAAVTFVNCAFLGNIAHSGGGLAVESQAQAFVNGSIFQDNTLHFASAVYSDGSSYYSSRGSAVFSANPSTSSTGGDVHRPVTLSLQNSLIEARIPIDAAPSEMGLLIFLVGVPQLFVFNTTVNMFSAASAVFISGVESDRTCFDELRLSCSLGYSLQRQISTSSLSIIGNVPSLSNSFPTVPISSFIKLSGFSASCSPCLFNTYTLRFMASSDNQDDILHQCTQCPFGAVCNGTSVVALPGFWGWIVHPASDNVLVDSFVLLPDGYGCGISDACLSHDACIPSRSGVLCGACSEGYTRSPLSKSCVPISSCSAGASAALLLFALSATFVYAAVIVFHEGSSSGVFQTLMWFYQTADLLLTGSNSLALNTGLESVMTVIRMVFNASPRDTGNGFSGICLAPNMSQIQIFLVPAVCHLCLLLFVLMLSLNCVFVRCNQVILRTQTLLKSAAKWFIRLLKLSASVDNDALDNEVSLNERVAALPYRHHRDGCSDPQVASSDSQQTASGQDSFSPFVFHRSIGRSLIMLLLLVYVSIMTYLVQFTTCLKIPEYPFPPGEDDTDNRWYYDGTQPCDGTRRTLATMFLVPISVFPMLLFLQMRKLIALDASGSLTPIQASALSYCVPPYSSIVAYM
jgi:hypothetical protein